MYIFIYFKVRIRVKLKVATRMCIHSIRVYVYILYYFIYYIYVVYIRSGRLIACRECVQNGAKDGGRNRELTRDRSVVSSRAASHTYIHRRPIYIYICRHANNTIFTCTNTHTHTRALYVRVCVCVCVCVCISSCIGIYMRVYKYAETCARVRRIRQRIRNLARGGGNDGGGGGGQKRIILFFLHVYGCCMRVFFLLLPPPAPHLVVGVLLVRYFASRAFPYYIYVCVCTHTRIHTYTRDTHPHAYTHNIYIYIYIGT
jgi:hypothetical protein